MTVGSDESAPIRAPAQLDILNAIDRVRSCYLNIAETLAGGKRRKLGDVANLMTSPPKLKVEKSPWDENEKVGGESRSTVELTSCAAEPLNGGRGATRPTGYHQLDGGHAGRVTLPALARGENAASTAVQRIEGSVWFSSPICILAILRYACQRLICVV